MASRRRFTIASTHDKPEWLEWLLDHGADIERREQDYGSTPLTTAVVHRHKRIIRTLG